MRKVVLGVGGALLLAVTMVACQTRAESGEDPHPNMSHGENPSFATPDNPVSSPSGEFVMEIEPGFEGEVYINRFHVLTEAGETVFVATRAYRTRDRLYFCWDDSDNIWVYSGDVGTSVWVKDELVWTEEAPGTRAMPPALREALGK